MQKAVLLIFALAVLAADPALACKELEKDQASAALYLLQRQSYVVKRCVTCQARVQGKVVLEAVVERDGSVNDVRVVESPHPMLDEAAIVAVQQWRYKPILIGGVPTRARVRISTTFGLK